MKIQQIFSEIHLKISQKQTNKKSRNQIRFFFDGLRQRSTKQLMKRQQNIGHLWPSIKSLKIKIQTFHLNEKKTTKYELMFEFTSIYIFE